MCQPAGSGGDVAGGGLMANDDESGQKVVRVPVFVSCPRFRVPVFDTSSLPVGTERGMQSRSGNHFPFQFLQAIKATSTIQIALVMYDK